MARALLKDSAFKVRAITRNVASDKAKELQKQGEFVRTCFLHQLITVMYMYKRGTCTVLFVIRRPSQTPVGIVSERTKPRGPIKNVLWLD